MSTVPDLPAPPASPEARCTAFLSALAGADLDLDRFMQDTVDAAVPLAGAMAAVIERVDGDEMVYRCASEVLAAHLGLRLARAGSLSGLCVERGQVLACDDVESDPRVDLEACRRVGVRSMICVPLFAGGEAVGVLKVMSRLAHGFSAREVGVLEILAGALGAALGQRVALDAQRRAEARLLESQARWQALLDNADDAVLAVDAQGAITEWSPAAERLFGWPRDEAVGQPVDLLIVPEAERAAHRAGFARFVAQADVRCARWRVERPALTREGACRVVELSLSAVRVGGHWEFLAFLHDIGPRKLAERVLHDAAMTDPLTALPNRRALMAQGTAAVERARRGDGALAVLFMDLDGLKEVNDRLGHEAGDRALAAFARRLRASVRRADVAARLAGDEFVVLAEGDVDAAQAQALARKIAAALESPLDDPPGLALQVSVGIALGDGAEDFGALLARADAAMYAAKHGDDGRVRLAAAPSGASADAVA